jgi:hypothetical protein
MAGRPIVPRGTALTHAIENARDPSRALLGRRRGPHKKALDPWRDKRGRKVTLPKLTFTENPDRD